VERQRDLVEESLEGPAGGEVNANATSGLTDASADFEQLGAESFDLGRTPGLG
jgi:hypothetical protein